MSVNTYEVMNVEKARVTTPEYRVAVVLAGCGAQDGAEITEAVSLIVQLQRAGCLVDVFAPDAVAVDTVNHLTGAVLPDEQRNLLTEAARIARGKVSPLETLSANAYSALAFAGGFGVAKNLCDFAFAGKDAVLRDDVFAAISQFVLAKKPVGALCIAPVLLGLYGKASGIAGLHLTLGDGSAQGAVSALESWGAHHVPCGVREACVDRVHKLVTAPAYMHGDASHADVFASAEALVKGLVHLLIQES